MKLHDPDPLVTIEALCRRCYFRGVTDSNDGDDTTWGKYVVLLRETLAKAFERSTKINGYYTIVPRPPLATPNTVDPTKPTPL